MTESEGRGLQAWVRLANAALERLTRQEAYSVVAGVPTDDLASMMSAASAASVATHTGGNLLYESAAARLLESQANPLLGQPKKLKRSTLKGT